MPRFDLELKSFADAAIGIVRSGEAMRHINVPAARAEWSLNKLEALHELAFLRAFAAWEACLEAIFLRSLCGYSSRVGQEQLIVGAYYPTLAAAMTAASGGQPFMLWHSTWKIINRCQNHIRSGPGLHALQENTIASHQARLNEFGAVRHRIVHVHQHDAKNKFDAATLSMAARTYPLSRPGKFLRDNNGAFPPRKWLDVITDELVGLTSQMV
jgi:hypothetical protein